MSDYARCPNCEARKAEKVSFTWWGGFIGPAMLSHVQCRECGTQYNGKTGQSNTTGIVIYTAVVLAIVIAVVVALNVAGV